MVTASRSQRKGRRGECELAHILQGHGFDVRPGEPLNYGTEPDLVGLPMIHCEVKRCQQLRLSEWMQQASDDAEKFGDGVPAIFFRRNREAWMVCMKLENWVQLYQKAQGCRCGVHCQGRHEAGETGEKTQK